MWICSTGKVCKKRLERQIIKREPLRGETTHVNVILTGSSTMGLTEAVKKFTIGIGADIVGVVSVAHLEEVTPTAQNL